MTKAPTPKEKSEKQRDNTKNATKNFDFTIFTNRLRTVSWRYNSNPAGVIKAAYERITFHSTYSNSRGTKRTNILFKKCIFCNKILEQRFGRSFCQVDNPRRLQPKRCSSIKSQNLYCVFHLEFYGQDIKKIVKNHS